MGRTVIDYTECAFCHKKFDVATVAKFATTQKGKRIIWEQLSCQCLFL